MIKGKLYVVATPIGNLSDITFRAVDVLRKVSFILVEDRKESAKLLKKYEVDTKLILYKDENHARVLEKILEVLDMGMDLALISDSGTPVVSDPGYRLVKYLRENDYVIVAIPGPSALISALSISGLSTDRFVFFGFLPESKTRRERIISGYKNLHNTLLFYESPERLLGLLNTLLELLGDVKVFLAKDISKLKEEHFYGRITEIKEKLYAQNFSKNPNGEFVCIVETEEKR